MGKAEPPVRILPDRPPPIDPDLTDDQAKAAMHRMVEESHLPLSDVIAWVNGMMAARWERWRAAANAAELERLRRRHSQRSGTVAKPAKVLADDGPTLFQEAS